MLWCLYHGGGDGASGVAAALVALHVASYAERLTAAGVGAAEWLLASVAVRVDAQAGWSGEGLVASPADIPVVVLLVGCRAGRREVVVVLPGRSDGSNHLLVCGRCRHRSSGGARHSSGGLVGAGRSLVVHGGRSRGFNRRRVRGHTGGRRSVGSSGNVVDRALAGDRGSIGRARQCHGGLRVRLELDGLSTSHGRSRGRVVAAVEARFRAQRWSRRAIWC